MILRTLAVVVLPGKTFWKAPQKYKLYFEMVKFLNSILKCHFILFTKVVCNINYVRIGILKYFRIGILKYVIIVTFLL